MTTTRNHLPTLAAVAVLAMCATTAAHEALGHGGACLVQGGAIDWLSSSQFRCDRPLPGVDVGGPAANLVVGALAWLGARRVRAPASRLLLVLIGAMAWFWEGAYAVWAMLIGDGDLYFGLRDALGRDPAAARLGVAAAGVGLYALALRTTRSALQAYPAGTAGSAWIAASLAALLAAVPCARDGMHGVRDAGLEIGLASPALLRIRPNAPTLALPRNPGLIAAAVVVFAVFVLTLGRGLPWGG